MIYQQAAFALFLVWVLWRIAKLKDYQFNDGWNCRAIEDARKAREKLEARRGRYGQFKPRDL